MAEAAVQARATAAHCQQRNSRLRRVTKINALETRATLGGRMTKRKLSTWQMTRMAREAPERYVLRVEYTDKTGEVSRRIISPIRQTRFKMLALCLCRCEPRWFDTDRLNILSLENANDFVMPVEMEVVQAASL